jgi:4-hydroxy-tetrahydrodipicolinate reductase
MTDDAPAGGRIRVGVTGATGKMGRVLCAAVMDDPQLELVAAVGRSRLGTPLGKVIGRGDEGPPIRSDLQALVEAGAEVAVDFTHPEAVMGNARWYLEHRLHAVIGTTGLSPADIEELRAHAEGGAANMVISPDFSPAGVIYLHIGKIAARLLDEVELFEVHPPGKAEAPSGTTVNTARALARVREGRPGSQTRSKEVVAGALGGVVDGIRVHAFRLSGAVGHEEMRFAHRGDTLTLSTTSHSREGYTAGVILAVKAVRDRPGLTWGLEPLLGFDTD